MSDLSTLKKRWQSVAELAAKGKYDEALILLNSPVPQRLAEKWATLNDMWRDELEAMIRYNEAFIGHPRFAIMNPLDRWMISD